MHVKSMSNAREVTGHVVLAARLDPLDRRPVDLCGRGELLLGEVPVHAEALHASGGGAAGGEDPRLFWGWHPAHATGFMIDCQQQY